MTGLVRRTDSQYTLGPLQKSCPHYIHPIILQAFVNECIELSKNVLAIVILNHKRRSISDCLKWDMYSYSISECLRLFCLIASSVIDPVGLCLLANVGTIMH